SAFRTRIWAPPTPIPSTRLPAVASIRAARASCPVARRSPHSPSLGTAALSNATSTIPSESEIFRMTQTQGTRAAAIARMPPYTDGGAFEAELARRVAFRTESQKLPDSLAELRRYLEEEMTPSFARLGFTTRIYDNPRPGQGPVLLATRIEAPGLPTVLG